MMLAFVHLPIPLLDVGSGSAGAPTRKEKLSGILRKDELRRMLVLKNDRTRLVERT
jgi:hypothetical protein